MTPLPSSPPTSTVEFLRQVVTATYRYPDMYLINEISADKYHNVNDYYLLDRVRLASAASVCVRCCEPRPMSPMHRRIYS